MTTIFLIIIGYFLGSIPFGYLFGRIANVDVTKRGSGNIGATNVARIIGPKAGIAVFILDLLKGTVAASLAIYYLGDPLLVVLVGLGAILGHMYSVFLGFKGGKGSAVGLGVLLGVTPDVFFFVFLIVALVMLMSRYVSLASIIGALTTTLLMLLLGKPVPYFILSLLACILILIKHKSNIGRLISGTERKIGEKS
ncbi:glycerol-3-phosphate 1-O-acyltransferase PlsY [Candidatus Saganbacteria bacterium]|nr:glycerol-3-phosphate 1-O-acyltransferase PlsY [Candidatus Saganbacteria bacterium]